MLPDPDAVAATLGRIPLRVHMDIVASIADAGRPPPASDVLLLPATTRYEMPGRGDRDDAPSAA